MPEPQKGEPSWRYRRLAIYAVTIWACYQLYLLIDAQDTRLNETLAWGWQVLIITLVLGYTGFATIQDVIAIWRMRTGQPYREPQSEHIPEGWPDDIAPPGRKDGEL
ncbi:hypothetical protein [Hoeflea sp.]|uniref:hypothetical protein n=1 Tax=Hoeflea sp. TaxID=1940281 RepID=UPI0037487AD7